MFINTNLLLKIVFVNTNFKIPHLRLAISWFILFLCNVKQRKQNEYEKNYEGNSSHHADDVFCGGLQ